MNTTRHSRESGNPDGKKSPATRDNIQVLFRYAEYLNCLDSRFRGNDDVLT